MATWPAGFPAPQMSGFEGSPEQLFARTDFEAGPPRQRRRSTAGWQRLSVTWVLSRTQFGTFRTLWTGDLADGAAWCDITLDLGAGPTAYEMRFVEPYRYAPHGSREYWRVSGEVEIR